jgi:hypothetical protein
MVRAADQSSIMLKFVGYSAASVLTMMSVVANARFGWTLGSSWLDRAAFVATSVGIDLFKVTLPLLAMQLGSNRHAPSPCGSVAPPGPPTLRLASWQRHAVRRSRSGLLTRRLALDESVRHYADGECRLATLLNHS